MGHAAPLIQDHQAAAGGEAAQGLPGPVHPMRRCESLSLSEHSEVVQGLAFQSLWRIICHADTGWDELVMRL